MILCAYRYILSLDNKFPTHKIACVSWPTVIMILERQMFDNFIYIFSDFLFFEMENSIWITIHLYIENQN